METTIFFAFFFELSLCNINALLIFNHDSNIRNGTGKFVVS